MMTKKSGQQISSCGWERTERAVRDAFRSVGDRLEAPGSLKRRIDSRIMEETAEEERMKHFSIKKTVVLAGAACLLVGTVCVASSGHGFLASGMMKSPVYTEFTDMEKAQETLGYRVDVVEKFTNGFAYDEFNVEETDRFDEAHKKIGSFPGLWMAYRKGNDMVSLDAHKLFEGEAEEDASQGRTPDKTASYGDGVTVNFYQTTYKFVPLDYELTDEDRANMEKPNYEISVGVDEVEVQQSYAAIWIKDGVKYGLQGFNLPVTPDGLLNMAGEIIESGIQ